jgi:hypothetical protein
LPDGVTKALVGRPTGHLVRDISPGTGTLPARLHVPANLTLDRQTLVPSSSIEQEGEVRRVRGLVLGTSLPVRILASSPSVANVELLLANDSVLEAPAWNATVTVDEETITLLHTGVVGHAAAGWRVASVGANGLVVERELANATYDVQVVAVVASSG